VCFSLVAINLINFKAVLYVLIIVFIMIMIILMPMPMDMSVDVVTAWYYNYY